jgi:hypothetical protein
LADISAAAEGRRQKAEGRRQKAEGRRQKAESRKQKTVLMQFEAGSSEFSL